MATNNFLAALYAEGAMPAYDRALTRNQGQRRARMEEEAAQRRNRLTDLEIDQQQRFNALAADPSTSPDQFARAGRSDIANALTNSESTRNAALARLGAVAQKALTLDPQSRRMFAKQAMQSYGGTFRALGMDPATQNFDAVSDDQLQKALEGIAVYGPQKLETIGDVNAPEKGILQRDPVTGELKKVTDPLRPEKRTVEWKDAGDRLEPVFSDSGQDVPGLSPKRKGVSPAAANSNDNRAFRDVQSLRKEFEGMDAVKNYKLVLPLFNRAEKAPNTRAGDISVIYALGKMFDPGSVVREGELTLSQNAAPWLHKLADSANSQLSGEGALSPDTRTAIMDALRGQVEALQQPYEQERERFTNYATEGGWRPDQVVGAYTPAQAFNRPPPAAPPPGQPAAEVTATGPNGQKLVLRNGQWVPLGK